MDTTARIIALVGLVAFAIPLVFMPFVGGPYDSWVQGSHLFVVLISAACGVGLRSRWLSPEAGLYILGITVALSNILLIHRVPDPVNTIPVFVLSLIALVISIPLGIVAVVCGISALTLVYGLLRYGWWVEAPLLMLCVVAFGVLIVATQLVRVRREAYYQEMRNRALEAAEEIRASADREKALIERIHQDEKLRSLGSLAGGVVHDLNNLLVPIVGNADLLLRGQVDQASKDQLREILRAADRASQLTRQLNAFAGGGMLTLRKLEVVAEIDEIFELVWRGLPEKVAFAWKRPSSQIWVEADRAQLHQIVANLLTNAAEAVSTVAAPCITLRTVTEDGYLLVSVQDNGPGIDPEVRERLFEPFISTKGDGRGMGLAAVQGAVTRLGGEILVDTSPGEGTTLTVRLPTCDAPISAQLSDALENEEDTPLSVLVVEDEEHVRAALLRMINELSDSVYAADSGEEALRLISSGLRPSVVVTDLRMPGIGGVQTINEIDKIVPEQPVVVCSGHDAGSMQALSERSNLVVLSKPVLGAELRDAIQSVAQA